MSWLDDLPKCASSGKFIHTSEASAWAQVEMLRQSGKGGGFAYRHTRGDRPCGGWHVSHTGLSPRARRQLRNTIKVGRARAQATRTRRKR